MFHFFNLSLMPVSGFHSDFSLNGTDYYFDANEFCLPFACGLARARDRN